MFDLLQAMHQDGFLTSTEVHALRKTCKELGENQVRVLRSLNIASCEQIQDYLQKYFGVLSLSKEALELLDESYQAFMPQDLALHYSCFGLGEERGMLFVALEDPTDTGTLDQLRFFLNKKIKAVCASVYEIAQALQQIYRLPVDKQKLSTAIDLSRGVIAGVPYQENFVNQVKALNENTKGAPLGLEESENGALLQTTETEPSPSTATLLHEEKELLEKLGIITSHALVKLSLISNREKALELLNLLLNPVEVQVVLTDDAHFRLEGEGFQFEGSSQTPQQSPHPILDTLSPVIQKVMRMK
jgi:hypothetical protein